MSEQKPDAERVFCTTRGRFDAALREAEQRGRDKERARLVPYLDHRWKCAIAAYIRRNVHEPNAVPVCNCGYAELVKLGAQEEMERRMTANEPQPDTASTAAVAQTETPEGE